MASLEAEGGDLKRAQGKAEADVEQVRTRIDRDRKRLDAGQVSSPRELENLQSEIASASGSQLPGYAGGAARAIWIVGAQKVVPDLPAALRRVEDHCLPLLYERMRVQHGGVGAAALRGGRCEGCHLSLNTVDLNTIRAADPDEVLRCEECRRILVRTPESGL